MTSHLKSYGHKGYEIIRGLCESHPDNWLVMDFNNYNDSVGSVPTGICTKTIREAKKYIDQLTESK